MSFKVKVNITVKGEEVYSEQVLGDYDDFDEDLKEKYGLPTEFTDEYTHTMSVVEFKKMSTEQFCREVSSWSDEVALKVIAQYKDPDSFVNKVPSWSTIGNAVIVIDSIKKYEYMNDVELMVCGG